MSPASEASESGYQVTCQVTYQVTCQEQANLINHTNGSRFFPEGDRGFLSADLNKWFEGRKFYISTKQEDKNQGYQG